VGYSFQHKLGLCIERPLNNRLRDAAASTRKASFWKKTHDICDGLQTAETEAVRGLEKS